MRRCAARKVDNQNMNIMQKYFPHTKEDLADMLRACGMTSLDDLSADIPESIRFWGDYDLPEGMSEVEIRRFFQTLAAKNKQLVCFAGAGVYDHYCPSVAQNIIERSEFLTSYTPYQAEISQGTLHYIFEYQTMMSELTGMPVSNASMYDGTTATAEAMLMAYHTAKKADTVLLSDTVDGRTRDVTETYAKYHGVKIELIPAKDGVTDHDALEARLAEGGVAGVILQQPNRYGIVEDFSGVAEKVHDAKALFIINSIAADLAVLRTPGEWGADIAVGEGQSLGLPMAFGGPYIGYMCCTEKLMRKMPGRIVGQTVDNRGQRAFVLTLQAREQHIRRHKATSNICSNESLMALYVTIYMSLMGREGLKEAARLSYAAAHCLCDRLTALPYFHKVYDKPFFNEFAVRYDGDVESLQRACAEQGYMAGVNLGDNVILFAATEKNTREDIDNLIKIIQEEAS